VNACSQWAYVGRSQNAVIKSAPPDCVKSCCTGNDWRRTPFSLTGLLDSIFKSSFNSSFEQSDRRTHRNCRMHEGRMLLYGYLPRLRGTEPAWCPVGRVCVSRSKTSLNSEATLVSPGASTHACIQGLNINAVTGYAAHIYTGATRAAMPVVCVGRLPDNTCPGPHRYLKRR
jgi:hypothetical protein